MVTSVKRVVFILAAAACSGGAGQPVDPGTVLWLARPGTEDSVPFEDRNANGSYDPFVDPLGYCRTDGVCHIPDARLMVHRLRRNGTAGSSAGVLIWAQGSTPRIGHAPTLELPLCTDGGTCSQPMTTPFAGVPDGVHALWLCDTDSAALDVASVSVDGASPIAIASHPHVQLVAEPRGARGFEIQSSEAIDRILVRLVRLDSEQIAHEAWSAGSTAETVRLDGDTRAHVEVPEIARAACSDCLVMIQVARVWRDDEVRDISEAWLTLPMHDGGR